MKILVTGGLGYIGSHLVREIPGVFPKAEIIILDDLSLGCLEILKVFPLGQYQFIKGDVRIFDFKKLGLGPQDFVIHLAALSRPEESFDRSHDFETVNFEGAMRAAAYCQQTGAGFFFPSTVSVYSRSGGAWIHTTGRYLKPQTPYAAIKLRAEKKLRTFKKLRFTIARFGTVYGYAPGISYSTAVNKFCLQAFLGEALTVWNTAWNQYRPYLAVEDASRFILHLLREKEFHGKTYHAASDHATVASVVRKIQKCRGEAVKVQRVDAKAMNRLSYRVSAKCLVPLGFKTQGTLSEGIRGLMAGLRKVPKFLKKKSGKPQKKGV